MMRMAEQMMKDKSITDYSESSDIGQIANEMVASVNTFSEWVNEQFEKGQ